MRPFKLFLLLAIMSSFLLTGCWPHQAGPTEVGVRTVKLGLFKSRGVEQKYYAPGKTYFFMPIINDWHTFDTKLQTMEMTFDPKRGDLRARDDLLFKTIDGNDISLDVIIQYRIDPKMAPNILQNVAQDDFLLRQKVVRAVVPRNIRLSEAPSFGQPIIIYDPRSHGAVAYRDVAKEVHYGSA